MSKNAGEVYEQQIVSLLNSQGIKVIGSSRSAFDKHSNDVTVNLGQLKAIAAIPNNYNNKLIIIEIKASPKARMGSGSLGVEVISNSVELSNYNNAVDEYVFEDVAKIFQEPSTANLRNNIKNFLKRANELQGIKTPVYAKLPMRLPLDVWDKLVKERHVAGVSYNIAANSDAIRYHYSKKGVQYIQIGNSGLFKLRTGVNPLAGLYQEMTGDRLKDMPLFAPSVRAELRAGRSGSDSKNMVSVNYRVEYRLTSVPKSPYSLDNVNDIRLLFGLNK